MSKYVGDGTPSTLRSIASRGHQLGFVGLHDWGEKHRVYTLQHTGIAWCIAVMPTISRKVPAMKRVAVSHRTIVCRLTTRGSTNNVLAPSLGAVSTAAGALTWGGGRRPWGQSRWAGRHRTTLCLRHYHRSGLRCRHWLLSRRHCRRGDYHHCWRWRRRQRDCRWL